MLLKSLCNYGEKNGVAPLGYGLSTVRCEVVLNPNNLINSRFAILETVKITEKKNKKGDIEVKESRTLGRKFLVPEIRRNGLQPKLISDTAEYIIGKREGRREAYLDLLNQCYEATRLDQIKWLIEFVENLKALPEGIDLGDRLNFRLEGQDDYLTNLEDVKQFWINYVSNINSQTQTGQCLVTGQNDVALTPKFSQQLKGVPGGNSIGCSLFSAYCDSFSSYGLKGAFVSPMSIDADNKIHQVLNDFLADKNRTIRLGNVGFVFWSDHESSDPFAAFDSPEALPPEVCRRYLELAYKPDSIAEGVTEQFHLLALSGNGGRAIVNHYSAYNQAEVDQNLGRWLNKQLNTPGFGRFENYSYLSIYRLAEGVLTIEKKDAVFRKIAMAFLLNAVEGKPIPSLILQMLVLRNRRRPIQWRQAVILNLYCNETMTPQQKIADLYGRVLATFAKAQMKAQKDCGLEDTNASKCFANFGVSPQILLHRLSGNFQHHCREIKKKPTSASQEGQEQSASQTKELYYVSRVKNLMSEIVEISENNPIPKQFNFDQQAYFDRGWWSELNFSKKTKDS